MPDNRELALLITVATFVVLVLSFHGTRQAAFGVLKCLFWSRLTIAAIGAILWLGLAIWCFWKAGIWEISNLKDTLYWFATGGCLLIYQGMQEKNPNKAFRDLVAEQFKAFLFFELLVNAYPFSLTGEFILLLGTSFLAMMIAFAEQNPAHNKVLKILWFVMGLVVIFVTCSAVYHLAVDPTEIFSWEGLQVFAFPIIYTLWLAPYGYLLTVYAAYETLFANRIAHHAMMPASVRRYAKRRLFMICGFNANAVRRAEKYLPVDFRWSETRTIVDVELLRLNEELHWFKEPE